MYRGLALWEEKGPPSTLSPCPGSDQLVRLDVFIFEIAYSPRKLFSRGDSVFSPAHQSRKPRARATDQLWAPRWQLARCSSVTRLIQCRLHLDRNLFYCYWCSGERTFGECCILLLFVGFFSCLWNWYLLFKNGAAWARWKPHVSTSVFGLLQNRLDPVK